MISRAVYVVSSYGIGTSDRCDWLWLRHERGEANKLVFLPSSSQREIESTFNGCVKSSGNEINKFFPLLSRRRRRCRVHSRLSVCSSEKQKKNINSASSHWVEREEERMLYTSCKSPKSKVFTWTSAVNACSPRYEWSVGRSEMAKKKIFLFRSRLGISLLLISCIYWRDFDLDNMWEMLNMCNPSLFSLYSMNFDRTIENKVSRFLGQIEFFLFSRIEDVCDEISNVLEFQRNYNVISTTAAKYNRRLNVTRSIDSGVNRGKKTWIFLMQHCCS